MDDANEIVALPTGLRRHIVKTIEFRKRRKKKDSGRKKKTAGKKRRQDYCQENNEQGWKGKKC
tara:strand:+ start:108 stop:296 length:189 start_codon:yes stop_codon:yes gene_type:complete